MAVVLSRKSGGGSGGGAPSGPAGGVLGGTYPDPSFAVDMATQAELNVVDGRTYWDGIVRKAVTEEIASSVALQNDDELLFPILASVNYYFELLLSYDAAAGSGTPDIKHDFVVSAGSIGLSWRHHVGIATAGNYQESGVNDMSTAITNGTATPRVCYLQGAVIADQDANFIFRWAQNTSDLNATRVLAGSTLSYRALD